MTLGSVWAVVRYVPDVVAGERVNIAVIAVSRDVPAIAVSRDVPSEARLRWTEATLARMKWLDPSPPIDAVVSLLGSIQDDIARGTFDVAALERLAGEWNNMIQVSRPGPSTLSVDDTIERLVPLLFPGREAP